MKNKYVVVVIIVAIIVVLYVTIGKQQGDYLGIATKSPTGNPSGTVRPLRSPTQKTTAPIATPTKPYSQLINEYEGRRIQFDNDCQAIPKDVTYKNNTNILLDNRADVPRNITVGGIKYSIGAFGYKVISLNSQTLPKEMGINCGPQINVGKILLQGQIYQP